MSLLIGCSGLLDALLDRVVLSTMRHVDGAKVGIVPVLVFFEPHRELALRLLTLDAPIEFPFGNGTVAVVDLWVPCCNLVHSGGKSLKVFQGPSSPQLQLRGLCKVRDVFISNPSLVIWAATLSLGCFRSSSFCAPWLRLTLS